jgi:hypothetical protein
MARSRRHSPLAGVKQQSIIDFGDPAILGDTELTVVLNGTPITVSTNGTPIAMSAAAPQFPGVPVTITVSGNTITYPDSVDPVAGRGYLVIVDGKRYNATASGTSWTQVLSDLETAIEAGVGGNVTYNATAQTLTLSTGTITFAAVAPTKTWTEMLSEMETALEATNLVTVVGDNTLRTLTLTGASNNVDFSIDAVAFSQISSVTDDGASPTTAAGTSIKQVSTIQFNESVAPVIGYTYAVTVNSHIYDILVDGTDVLAQWHTADNKGVLDKLAAEIDAGEAITGTVDAANRKLTLTADAFNTAFTVSDAGVTLSAASEIAGAAAKKSLQAAVAGGVQTSSLDFGSTVHSDTLKYTVNIGGVAFTTTSETSLANALASLAGKINHASTGSTFATAVVAGNTLNLTGETEGVSFVVSGNALDTTSGTPTNPNVITGSKVVIVPDRDPGSYGMKVTGSLTVVNLPTNDGETINLIAGDGVGVGDLVVVSPLDVGDTGTVILSADGGVTLGGKVTAGSLEVSSGKNLTITSEVGTMEVTMTGDGDLTVFQTGALSISSITMPSSSSFTGRNITLVADGDINIGSIRRLCRRHLTIIVSRTGRHQHHQPQRRRRGNACPPWAARSAWATPRIPSRPIRWTSSRRMAISIYEADSSDHRAHRQQSMTTRSSSRQAVN